MKTPAGEFVGRVVTALEENHFVRLLLSKPVLKLTAIQRIVGRLVELKSGTVLSLTMKEAARDTTRNLFLAEVPEWLTDQLNQRFGSAVLETTKGGWQYVINRTGRARLVAHKSRSVAVPEKRHDRVKTSWLGSAALPWLVALGLCDGTGRVRPSAVDKHRQLERFLEILSHLVRDCGWTRDRPLAIVDMGCGKGYLTFGVWHLLNQQMNLNARVTGVEARPALVEQANAIAHATGAGKLRFIAGDIASVKLERVDGLIALHACNTATDEAIARGVQQGARLIVVSPCCHQEIRPQLGPSGVLEPLLHHGILSERLSEWLTDGLRTLRLEQAGYSTKMIEFIPSEHTPRNLLITGVRRESRLNSSIPGNEVSALKKFFGLGSVASDKISPEDGN